MRFLHFLLVFSKTALAVGRGHLFLKVCTLYRHLLSRMSVPAGCDCCAASAGDAARRAARRRAARYARGPGLPSRHTRAGDGGRRAPVPRPALPRPGPRCRTLLRAPYTTLDTQSRLINDRQQPSNALRLERKDKKRYQTLSNPGVCRREWASRLPALRTPAAQVMSVVPGAAEQSFETHAVRGQRPSQEKGARNSCAQTGQSWVLQGSRLGPELNLSAAGILQDIL